jgi:hypothetical protein
MMKEHREIAGRPKMSDFERFGMICNEWLEAAKEESSEEEEEDN